ncbi:hypothetical protein GJAV_G00103580 [Gymnothorax javanicus]|nr:hypothetical protein GJAV_G00103580 [Gymnothorax javanicus]
MTTFQSFSDDFLSNEEDARTVEDAIKAAIKAVMCVLCNINENKIRQYKMMVAERDKENERLRMLVKSAENELISLRRYRRTVGQNGPTDSAYGLDSEISVGGNGKQGLCAKAELRDAEEDAHGQPQSVWNNSTSSCVEHQGLGTATDASQVDFREDIFDQPQREWPDGCPLKSDGETRQSAVVPGPIPVKQESPDYETVHIKWEVCDRSTRRNSNALPTCESTAASVLPRDRTPHDVESQTSNFSPSRTGKSGSLVATARQKRNLANREKVQRYRARIRADPERYRRYREMDRRRYHMRKKSIKDLPEHCQKLKRAAWRQAARRHRARKKSSPPIGPHADLQLDVNRPLDLGEILQSWDPTACSDQGNLVQLG